MRKNSHSKKKNIGTLCVIGIIVMMGGGLTYNDSVQASNIQTSNVYIEKTREIEGLITKAKTQELEGSSEMNKVTKPSYKVNLPEEYQNLVWKLCQQNDLSYELALATMFHESNGFNLKAINVNNNGTIDRGLFQINSRSIEDYREYAIQYAGLPKEKKFDVHNPEDNIRAGIGGLVHFRNLYRDKGVGEENLAYFVLGSYNRGKEGYSAYVSRNNYLETEYSNKVLYYKEQLERYGELKK